MVIRIWKDFKKSCNFWTHLCTSGHCCKIKVPPPLPPPPPQQQEEEHRAVFDLTASPQIKRQNGFDELKDVHTKEDIGFRFLSYPKICNSLEMTDFEGYFLAEKAKRTHIYNIFQTKKFSSVTWFLSSTSLHYIFIALFLRWATEHWSSSLCSKWKVGEFQFSTVFYPAGESAKGAWNNKNNSQVSINIFKTFATYLNVQNALLNASTLSLSLVAWASLYFRLARRRRRFSSRLKRLLIGFDDCLWWRILNFFCSHF